jgi:molybdate transport system substrate-binding protein
MRRFPIALLLIVAATAAHAEPLRIAVAANFQDTFDTLVTAYAQRSSDRIEASYGATGMLYTQIINGAPFAAFFSADDERTAQLVTDGRARPASRFIYAIGHLTLWTPGSTTAPDPSWLADASHRIAIANPELAPYGRAAQQTLTALELWDGVQPRLVTGTSIGQTMQFVVSGGVPGGFVAQSQLVSHFHGAIPAAEVWRVPQNLHTPIVQEAVALNTPEASRVESFFAFVASADGCAIIEAGGYSVLAPVKPPAP